MALTHAGLLKQKIEAFRLANANSSMNFMESTGFSDFLQSIKALQIRRNRGASQTTQQINTCRLIETYCTTLNDWSKTTLIWGKDQEIAVKKIIKAASAEQLTEMLAKLDQALQASPEEKTTKTSSVPMKSVSIADLGEWLTYPAHLLFQLALFLGFYSRTKAEDRRENIKLSTVAQPSLKTPAKESHPPIETDHSTAFRRGRYSDLKRQLSSEEITLTPTSALKPEAELLVSGGTDESDTVASKTSSQQVEQEDHDSSTLHQRLAEYLETNQHPDGWTSKISELSNHKTLIEHSDRSDRRLPQHDIMVSNKEVTATISLKAPEKDITYMANTMFYSYIFSGGTAEELNLDAIKHPSMKLALELIQAEYLTLVSEQRPLGSGKL